MASATNPKVADRFVPDPNPLFFRIFCGRVVKPDPVTGIQYLVPFAPAPAESDFPLEEAGPWSVATTTPGRFPCRRRFQLRS